MDGINPGALIGGAFELDYHQSAFARQRSA